MKRALAERAKQQTNEQQQQQKQQQQRVPHVSATSSLRPPPLHVTALAPPLAVPSDPNPIRSGTVPVSVPDVPTVGLPRSPVPAMPISILERDKDAVSNESPTQGDMLPPKKIPRVDHSDVVSVSANTNASAVIQAGAVMSSSSAVTISSPSHVAPMSTVQKSKKRIRPPASVLNGSSIGGVGGGSLATVSSSSSWNVHPPQDSQQQQQQGDDSSAFFLKHQNKALASELYQYKYTIGLLTKEREKRRQECRDISKCLQELVCVWDTVEEKLEKSLRRDVRVEGHPVVGQPQAQPPSEPSSTMGLPQDMPASTGEGFNVEETQNIIQSIVSLVGRRSNHGTTTTTPSHPFSIHSGNEEDKEGEGSDIEMKDHAKESHNGQQDVDSDNDDSHRDGNEMLARDSQREIKDMCQLSKSVSAFSQRCHVLYDLILELVQRSSEKSIHCDSVMGEMPSSTSSSSLGTTKALDLEKQLHGFQGKVQDLEIQIKELAKARDEANERERRVRRGLYRVATGRLELGEVLKAVEKDGFSTLDEIAELEQDILGSAAQPITSMVPSSDVGVPVGSAISGDVGADNSASHVMLEGKILTTNDVQLMKKKIDDLILVNESKEKRLNELAQENLENQKTVNSLMAEKKNAGETNLQDEEIRSSKIFIELSQQLSATERKVEKLTKELSSVMERWALTKGDLESCQNTIKDLEEKHSKRLKELTGGDDESNTGNNTHLDQAKLVMELEHKLKHALDNVRQSETIKISLAESQSMNEILQRRIGELKAQNEQLEAENKNEGGPDPQDAGASKDKLHRLKRDYSELKHKFEHNEKERASLVAMNMRLQQQSIEKDDMNAKSLSTILHLKQITEKLEEEKESLEKKLKSAQQLALAARLAANAKTRVEEEAMREKAEIEEQMKELQGSLESLQKEKDGLAEQLAVANAKVESSISQMNEMKKRCDDLVAACHDKDQKHQKMEEELVVVKKDLIEAAQKAAASQAQSGNSSTGNKFETNFTAEELTIQVKQLKSRLACPVCNTRDKKVIITRCRHMFCRNCVAANLEGRNRKCPSCGIKFDKKDVEDVWF